MKVFVRHILWAVLATAVLGGLLSGCTRLPDDLDELAGGNGSDEEGLEFVIDTRGGFGDTHAPELSKSDEEIVINPDNFHVVLFSAQGEVKQIWANQELSERMEYDSTMGVDRKKYFVKIPRHDINDEVVQYIRNNDFKIAVFANWSEYPDFETTKGKVIDDNGIDHNNIFYISHCFADKSYSSGAEGQMDAAEVFRFITGKGSKMGMAQEWVCDRYGSDTETENAIRTKYKLNDDGTGEFLSNRKPQFKTINGEPIVDMYFDAMQDYTYYDVWQIWNFGGQRNLGNSNFYNTTNSALRQKWAQINEEWFKKTSTNTYLHISNAKTDWWMGQFCYELDKALVPGKEYTFSFNARSSGPEYTMNIWQMKRVDGKEEGDLGGLTAVLPGDNIWRHYSQKFKPTNDVEVNWLKFCFGDFGGTLDLDNILLTDENNNPLINSDFEDGTDGGWQNFYNHPYTYYRETVDSSESTIYLPGTTTIRGLQLVSTTDGDNNTNFCSHYDGSNYGIVLRKSSREASDDQTINASNGCYIHYDLPADGFLYVKCKKLNNNEDPQLVVRRGNLGSTGSSIAVATQQLTSNNIETATFSYEKTSNETIRVTGETADLTLYAIGGDIIIYEIDYIKSHHIQSVDRQMINPASTPEGGISMYGIQDFDQLSLSVWPDGTTFNLSRLESTHTGSDAASYKYRPISLLRSVAKVEVLVPTSLFPKPSHMHMRTLNRYSRSAPLDVFTPTNIIWDGSTTEYTKTSFVDAWGNKHDYKGAKGVDGENGEAELIRKDGFTYKYNDKNTDTYKNWVAWLFGIWNKEFGWNWAGESITIPSDKSTDYPRVFNTRIARSDFAHMIDGGKTTVDGVEYYYYYAYLPEKNVTDPNDQGTLDASPKVMRVEMRFGDRNTDANLDDNASYRIYFTPGGKGNGINSRDDYDDTMEKGSSNENSTQMTNLKNIYPVMRNHLYRFKIKGLSMNNLLVDFQVQGAESRDISYEFN